AIVGWLFIEGEGSTGKACDGGRAGQSPPKYHCATEPDLHKPEWNRHAIPPGRCHGVKETRQTEETGIIEGAARGGTQIPVAQSMEVPHQRYAPGALLIMFVQVSEFSVGADGLPEPEATEDRESQAEHEREEQDFSDVLSQHGHMIPIGSIRHQL